MDGVQAGAGMQLRLIDQPVVNGAPTGTGVRYD